MKITIFIIFCIALFGGAIANAGLNKEKDELQDKCCQKAAQAFKNEMAKNAGAFRVSNYYCHFNKQLNKCFMLEIFAKKRG